MRGADEDSAARAGISRSRHLTVSIDVIRPSWPLSDGVAGPDPQAHQTLMTSIFPRLAHIIDTARLHSLLHESHRSGGQ